MDLLFLGSHISNLVYIQGHLDFMRAEKEYSYKVTVNITEVAHQLQSLLHTVKSRQVFGSLCLLCILFFLQGSHIPSPPQRPLPADPTTKGARDCGAASCIYDGESMVPRITPVRYAVPSNAFSLSSDLHWLRGLNLAETCSLLFCVPWILYKV